jgi:hypothetical protein
MEGVAGTKMTLDMEVSCFKQLIARLTFYDVDTAMI